MEINVRFRSEIKEDPEQSPSALPVYLNKLYLWSANLLLGLHTFLHSFNRNVCWHNFWINLQCIGF